MRMILFDNKIFLNVIMLLLVHSSASAAIFKIANNTSEALTFDIQLAATWGKRTIRQTIQPKTTHTFNTGLAGVNPQQGITFSEGKYYIDGIKISTTSTGMVIVISGNKLNGYTYRWENKHAYFQRITSGGYPQGYGNVSQSY